MAWETTFDFAGYGLASANLLFTLSNLNFFIYKIASSKIKYSILRFVDLERIKMKKKYKT